VAGYILYSPSLWLDISFTVHCCGSKVPFQSKSLQERFFPVHLYCREASFHYTITIKISSSPPSCMVGRSF
jgi:hypothetical protein